MMVEAREELERARTYLQAAGGMVMSTEAAVAQMSEPDRADLADLSGALRRHAQAMLRLQRAEHCARALTLAHIIVSNPIGREARRQMVALCNEYLQPHVVATSVNGRSIEELFRSDIAKMELGAELE